MGREDKDQPSPEVEGTQNEPVPETLGNEVTSSEPQSEVKAYKADIRITEAVKSVLPSISVRQEVKKIATGDVVRKAVIDGLAAKEVEKNVHATALILELIEKNEHERKRIKPKPAGFSFDENGNKKVVGQPVFDPEQAALMENLLKEHTKLQKALQRGLEENDFTQISEIVSNSNKGNEGRKKE